MTRTALIVEDDEMLADLLATVLRGMDFSPTVLTHGATAAQWVREHRPDLVMLDVMLPDASGYDICEKIKLDRETNLTPVIIATALSNRSEMVRGLRVGANYYLTKPFTIDELQHAVDEVFTRKRELEDGGTSGEINFVLKSDIRYLADLNTLLSSLLLHTGLNQDQAFQLTAAVREMGSNAIEWGNRKQVEETVTVTYRIERDKIEIVIRDNGPGFDRENLPHAARMDDPAAHMQTREDKGLRPGGFGILMARGLVDELSYNDAGNEVRIIKRFPQSAKG